MYAYRSGDSKRKCQALSRTSTKTGNIQHNVLKTSSCEDFRGITVQHDLENVKMQTFLLK